MKIAESGYPCTAPAAKVVESVERSLAGVYFGSRMLENFRSQCEGAFRLNKAEGGKGKAGMVDLDKAGEASYPLFVYSDSMRAFSKVRAARSIQRWFRAGPWPPHSRVGGEGAVVGGDEEDGGFSSPRQKLEEARKLDAQLNVKEKSV